VLRIETFPLDDAAFVLAPASGIVAVVDAGTRDVLEDLRAGRGTAEVAAAWAGATGLAAAEALGQVEALRNFWGRLSGRRRQPAMPRPLGPAGTEPRLDAAIRLGPPPVRLRVWPPRLARVLAAVTAPCCGPVDGLATGSAILEVRRAGRTYQLVLDGAPVLRTDDWMIARSEVLRRLILAGNPDRQWLAVLHAAAVSGPAGAALLCGFSGAGKSTLTGYLLASGLALVTDDYAPIEASTGLVWPVPFGLSVKEGSWPLLMPHFPALAQAPVVRTKQRRQRYVAPPRAAAAPQPVRCLIFPLYQPGAGLELTALRPGEALELCARSGGWYENSPQRLSELVGWLGSKPAYALSYGDTAAAIAAVRGLLAA
jgi:hypothetical protein